MHEACMGAWGVEREGVEKPTDLHCHDGIARGVHVGASIIASLVVYGRRGADCGVISGYENASACGFSVTEVQAMILRSGYFTYSFHPGEEAFKWQVRQRGHEEPSICGMEAKISDPDFTIRLWHLHFQLLRGDVEIVSARRRTRGSLHLWLRGTPFSGPNFQTLILYRVIAITISTQERGR